VYLSLHSEVTVSLTRVGIRGALRLLFFLFLVGSLVAPLIFLLIHLPEFCVGLGLLLCRFSRDYSAVFAPLLVNSQCLVSPGRVLSQRILSGR